MFAILKLFFSLVVFISLRNSDNRINFVTFYDGSRVFYRFYRLTLLVNNRSYIYAFSMVLLMFSFTDFITLRNIMYFSFNNMYLVQLIYFPVPLVSSMFFSMFSPFVLHLSASFLCFTELNKQFLQYLCLTALSKQLSASFLCI